VSTENVELIKGMFSGFEGADPEAIREMLPAFVPQLCTEDIEFVETPERVDARTFRGHEGVVEAFNRWLDQWTEYDAEPVGFEDHGDDVFVVADEKARGHSGASVGARLYLIFTLRDGKVCRYREFYDQDAARAALGS
jgi:ketosteroid isomerase-like protein